MIETPTPQQRLETLYRAVAVAFFAGLLFGSAVSSVIAARLCLALE